MDYLVLPALALLFRQCGEDVFARPNNLIVVSGLSSLFCCFPSAPPTFGLGVVSDAQPKL